MRSQGKRLLRYSAAAVAILLFAAGCGLAADFAGSESRPDCEGPGCDAAAPANGPGAAPESPAASVPASTPEPSSELVSPESVTPRAQPATPAAFASEAATLGPVVWTAEIDPETRAPLIPVSSFPTSVDVIYATVAADRVEAGTEFTAAWTYNRTPLDGLADTVVAPADAEGIWIEFHLEMARPGDWPSGTYEISINVDGQPAVAGTVEVVEAGG